MTVIAVLGLGEAGRLYALDLHAAGYQVRGFDPYVELGDDRVDQVATIEQATAGVDLVISLVGARVAEDVARQALAHCPSHAVYADFNTGSPALKRTLAQVAAAHQVAFVDIAVMAPVPRRGAGTPLLAAGPGTETFASLVGAAGVPVDTVQGEAGAAASRKLLRSVFMKGMAALMLECQAAAAAAGQDAWLRQQILDELTGDVDRLIDRLVNGSRTHAARRVHEVEDAIEYLAQLGQPSWVMHGTRTWLTSLRDEH